MKVGSAMHCVVGAFIGLVMGLACLDAHTQESRSDTPPAQTAGAPESVVETYFSHAITGTLNEIELLTVTRPSFYRPERLNTTVSSHPVEPGVTIVRPPAGQPYNSPNRPPGDEVLTASTV